MTCWPASARNGKVRNNDPSLTSGGSSVIPSGAFLVQFERAVGRELLVGEAAA
jgi:hypothetical protein